MSRFRAEIDTGGHAPAAAASFSDTDSPPSSPATPATARELWKAREEHALLTQEGRARQARAKASEASQREELRAARAELAALQSELQRRRQEERSVAEARESASRVKDALQRARARASAADEDDEVICSRVAAVAFEGADGAGDGAGGPCATDPCAQNACLCGIGGAWAGGDARERAAGARSRPRALEVAADAFERVGDAPVVVFEFFDDGGSPIKQAVHGYALDDDFDPKDLPLQDARAEAEA